MMRKRLFELAAGMVVVTAALATPALAEEADGREDPLQIGLQAVNEGDLPAAIASLRIAADEGSAEAQAWLGYIFDYSEDDEEAVAYYRAAAEQGNVRGLSGLGEMYVKGEGVERNLEEGRKYFIKAAELGDAGSIRILIAAYEEGGLGVDPDVGQAEYWKARLAELEANDQ